MNLWGTPLGFSVALTRRSHNSCGEERSIGEREGKVDQRTNRDARRAVGEVRRKRSTGNNNARRAHLHESRRVLLQECQELAVDGCSALVHLLLLEEIVNHRYQHVVLDGQQLGDARRDPRFDNLPFDARHVHAPVKLGRVLQGSLLDVDAADDAAAAERLTCLGHPGSCREHALGGARWSARGTGPGQVKYRRARRVAEDEFQLLCAEMSDCLIISRIRLTPGAIRCRRQAALDAVAALVNLFPRLAHLPSATLRRAGDACGSVTGLNARIDARATVEGAAATQKPAPEEPNSQRRAKSQRR